MGFGGIYRNAPRDEINRMPVNHNIESARSDWSTTEKGMHWATIFAFQGE